MRKKISETIEVPSGISISLEGQKIKLSKGSESIEKELPYHIKIEENKIKLEHEKPTKKQKKLIKSSMAHIKNMIKGLEKKYIYKLQICSVHFPITVTAKGNEIIVKNFLGEIKERKTKILPGVNVKIDKEIITIESADKDKAGQTAANIESATRICNRDRRVFQDGIYIIEKHKGAKNE